MSESPDVPELPAGRSGHSVATAGGIMMASLLLSRVLGLVREAVFAAKFGIQLDADSYKVAAKIPDMIFMLIAGGGLSSAFIPVFSEYLYTDRERDAWKVFSVVVTLCTLVGTGLVALAWIFAPQIARFMCSGDRVDLMAPRVTELGRIMLPAQIAFLVGSVLLATLYARKRFIGPGLAPNVYNIGIIAGAFLGASFGIGVAGLAWGALIGAIVGNLLLPLVIMVGQGGTFRPSLDIKLPGVRKFFALLLPVILGFSLPSVCDLITQKFASEYPTGTNAVLSFSNNLLMAPLGIFGHSLALAAFPVLSQFFAQKRMDLYRDQVSKTMRTTIYLSMPAGAIMFALAPQVVNLAYGYGSAADNKVGLAETAAALQVLSLAVWAWCMQPILMRGFFSIHQTARPIIIGTIMTALFIVLCAVGVQSGASYLVLPWATNAAAVLLVIGLYIALEGQVGALDRKGVAATLAKSLVGSVVMAGLAYGLFQLVPNGIGKIPLLVVFAFVFCLVGWVYYFVTKALGMPETAYLSRAMDRINRKKK